MDHNIGRPPKGMIDMFDRISGPRDRVIRIVLKVQFLTAAISIGSIAAVFINSIFPVSDVFGGWLVSIFLLVTARAGGFKVLKAIISFFGFIILNSVLHVSLTVFPSFFRICKGAAFSDSACA